MLGRVIHEWSTVDGIHLIARSPKQARGCCSAIIRILAEMDHSP